MNNENCLNSPNSPQSFSNLEIYFKTFMLQRTQFVLRRFLLLLHLVIHPQQNNLFSMGGEHSQGRFGLQRNIQAYLVSLSPKQVANCR
jgi:hypothetical protein